jgi:segregation and condensation protein A
VEFLWSSLALFDDDTAAADTATVYQARPFELYAVAEARERILRLLAAAPAGASLEQFLPDPAGISENQAREKLRRRSAWSSTFIAGLELAKQGDVVLGQGGISRRSMSPRRPLGRRPERRGSALATP